MPDHLTYEEEQARDEWLAKNEPYRAARGESGLYDEFGTPLRAGREISLVTLQRLEKLRQIVSAGENLQKQEIARRLGMSPSGFSEMVNRWAGV